MKIGIIGGGSIGLLLAGRLGKQHEVTLFTRTECQADHINRAGGIEIKGIHPVFTACRAEAISRSKAIGVQDLLIVTVKQGAIDEILAYIQDVEMPLLFLQNGMGHLNKLDCLHSESVYVGITEHGALRENETTTIHTGMGAVRFGLYRGERQAALLGHQDDSDFPIEEVKDIYPKLIEKLIANACINPLTAVLGVRNGEIMANPYFRRVLKGLCKEICTGLGIEEEQHHEYLERVSLICERTADNKSSMLRDIEMHRKTEIESILGFCLEEANRRNEKMEAASMLYAMVRGLEESGGSEW
ncbi:2-dehydropantoate 2-reductase [Pradoshia sp.]